MIGRFLKRKRRMKMDFTEIIEGSNSITSAAQICNFPKH